MAWSEAITAVGATVKKVLDRFWGNQTRQEACLEQRAEEAAAAEQAALDRGDLAGAERARAELRRVRDEARAKAE